MLAETDWAGLVKAGGTASVIAILIYGIKLLMSGRIRLDREVSERDIRIAGLEERLEVAEGKLDQLYQSMMGDFSPALLKSSVSADRLESSIKEVVDQQKKLIDAFLRRMGEM